MRARFARRAKRLDLGNYLRLGHGEEKTGGREKPALLADAFEALIAAVYLDAGLPAAREFVKRALLETAIEAQGSAAWVIRPQICAAGVAAGPSSPAGAV